MKVKIGNDWQKIKERMENNLPKNEGKNGEWLAKYEKKWRMIGKKMESDGQKWRKEWRMISKKEEKNVCKMFFLNRNADPNNILILNYKWFFF